MIINLISTAQINLQIPRAKNKRYEEKEFLQECIDKMKAVSNTLFKTEFKMIPMKESHQITISIVGEFDPYHYDEDLSSDCIMKYDNGEDMFKGEISEHIEREFGDVEYNYHYGRIALQEG